MASRGEAPQEYTRRDVRRMLNVSEQRLRSWEKLGFVPSTERFTFSDLIALRALQRLAGSKIPPKEIGRALLSLKQKLGETTRPLNDLRIVSDGKTISVQVAGQKMEAVSGQLLFDFDSSEIPSVRTLRAKELLPNPKEDRDAERWFQQGLSLEETGAPIDQAREAYQKAIELNPGAAGALVNLGTIAFRARRLREAAAYYERAIAADPHYPLAHFNLGNVFDEMGQSTVAKQHYEMTLQLDPNYVDAHFNLALIAERNVDHLTAVKHWKAYLKKDPASSWAAQARKQLERLRKLTVVE